MLTQPHVFPDELFGEGDPGPPRAWTCLRSRPRWEKKLAGWLAGRAVPHFLPILFRRPDPTRRSRVFGVPLLPGYVFAAGELAKSDFREAGGAVIDAIRPPPSGQEPLHRQLWALWRGLIAGSPLKLAEELAVGDPVEVVAGPLRGVSGRFQRWGGQGRLLLSVDVLGVGAAVEIDEGCVRAVRG